MRYFLGLKIFLPWDTFSPLRDTMFLMYGFSPFTLQFWVLFSLQVEDEADRAGKAAFEQLEKKLGETENT